MNRQQTNTTVRGFPRTYYNRNNCRPPPGGKHLYKVSSHASTQMYSGSYRNPEFGHAARNGVVYPVYVPPPMRKISHSLSRPQTGLNESDRNQSNVPTNDCSSSQDVRTCPVHSSRRPNRGKPISGVRSTGAMFAKGPDLEMDGGEPLEEEDTKLLEMAAHMGKVTLSEEKVTVSRPRSETTPQAVLPYHIQETLERLLATFKMTGSWEDMRYKSPDGWTDVNVDPKGNMKFLLTNRERYDIGIPLLLGTLNRVHQTCMMMRMRAQRALSTDKPNEIASQCLCVDPFEVSWSIQTHLFKMHKMGVQCVMMGVNNTLFIDTNILLLLIRDSLTRTYMSKENAYWAFKTIATVIANEW